MQKRRFFLIGLGAVGALTVAWGLLPPRQRLKGVVLPTANGQIALNAWLKFGTDGNVTLAMPKSEMGQGIHTALAMIVAEELDVPLASVRIEQSPIDGLYGNVLGLAEGIPFRPDDEGTLARTARWTMQKVMREMGIMMTGGSSSIKDLWLPLREAAAMARASLANTLAAEWNLEAASIKVIDGVFSSGEKRLGYAEVVEKFASKIAPASSYQLKALQDCKLLGLPTLRSDTPAKVNGSALFGIDANSADGKRPDFYAAVLLSPARGGAVASLDAKAALSMTGVKQIVALPANIEGSGTSGGVAVLATQYWQAKQALDALKVEWQAAPTSAWSSDTITQTLNATLDQGGGFTYYKKGDTKSILQKINSAENNQQLKATYSAPYLAHATMEPMNATVSLAGKGAERRATLTVGTQVPDLARAVAAKVLGLTKDKVTLNLPFLGGGFGRRLEVDTAAQAASIVALALGSEGVGTVQMIWSREADIQHDFYRPAAVARFEAALDSQGRISAWVNKAASQHIVPKYFPRNVGLPLFGPDKTSIEGAFDQAYEFPNAHVSHAAVELPIPIGFWRSVGHSHQAFFQESFLDECAQSAKPQDAFAHSVAYRRALLQQHPRHLAALNLAVAQHGALSTPQAALGVALHEAFGSIVAMVAEVSVGADKEIRAHKITAAIDCGFCVNPAGVAQQVESSVAFGLSAALWGKIDFANGKVAQSNFHNYRVLRMNEMPEVATHIISSTRPPEGMGEPALPPVAPAVANALFALTGQRLRDLPLRLT